jgi:hypothetical protein
LAEELLILYRLLLLTIEKAEESPENEKNVI